MNKISALTSFFLMIFLTGACSATAPVTPTPTSTPAPTATPIPTPTPEWYREGWDLVWQDEFNGSELDLDKWSHEVNGRGGGNNELQFYTDSPENSFIEDGNLVIEAREERYIGRDYTSARLRTVGKGDWQYGRFEARIKLPYGQGIWPAFWMLPSEWRYGEWPSSGEIDIMEMVGHEADTVHGTIHFGGVGNHLYTGEPYQLEDGIFHDDFHTFAVEWEEKEMRWYVDDVHFLTQNSWSTRKADYPAPFDQPFHIILNLAVGGDWPGSPDETTVFPQRMEVDYVRVYERTDN